MALSFRRTLDTLLNLGLLGAMLCIAAGSALCVWIAPSAHRRRKPASMPAPSATLAIGEFQFERAIEAYENLIDESLGENRV
jgi:hypothetical protein